MPPNNRKPSLWDGTMDTPDTEHPPEQPTESAPAGTEAAQQPVISQPVKPSAAKKSDPSNGEINIVFATGRRKEAIARVRLIPGPGTILINAHTFEQHFPREILRLSVRQPLLITHQLGKHNVVANVEGGGLTGQAGAVRLGIARALVKLDPALRQPLRSAGLLTRDPRMKERKKYGQKGARKRFQWTKR